jgi:hydrogenase nickel incorporation protein HypA/HybF
MHEMSIAVELVRQLEALAAEHGVGRVEELTVVAGRLRAVVPEALELAFAAAAEGTAAEGATLHLEFEDPQAVCRHCGLRYEPQMDSFLCGGCGRADVELVAGNDIVLKSVVCQEPDGVCDED